MRTDQDKLRRKLSREAELQHRQEYGTPRAKSWGGKKDSRQHRREDKRELRKGAIWNES